LQFHILPPFGFFSEEIHGCSLFTFSFLNAVTYLYHELSFFCWWVLNSFHFLYYVSLCYWKYVLGVKERNSCYIFLEMEFVSLAHASLYICFTAKWSYWFISTVAKFSLFCGTVVWTWASRLLGQCSTTWDTPPAKFSFLYFW
jgi:hypothetical protein